RDTGLLARDHVNVFKINGRPEYAVAQNQATAWVPSGSGSVQYTVDRFVTYDSHYYMCVKSHIASSGDPSEAWAKDFKNWELVEGYLPRDIKFNLDNTFVYEDGHTEPRKVLL